MGEVDYSFKPHFFDGQKLQEGEQKESNILASHLRKVAADLDLNAALTELTEALDSMPVQDLFEAAEEDQPFETAISGFVERVAEEFNQNPKSLMKAYLRSKAGMDLRKEYSKAITEY